MIAMPNEQTNSQRRFTVIELPVLPIVKESLLLPFKYLPELVKFGKMPFMLILAVDVFCYGLERQDISKSLTGSLMLIAHFILFTPFAVAWTKLAIRGRHCRRPASGVRLLANPTDVPAGDRSDGPRVDNLCRHPFRPGTQFPAKF
jgi:hypothetical protein